MARKVNWLVRLGRVEWMRFTYERGDGDDALRMLGSVQRGARIGALALTDDGRFVQVNGDHMSPLNASQIRCALEKASAGRPRPYQPRVSAPPSRRSAPPVVIVKRRRVLATP